MTVHTFADRDPEIEEVLRIARLASERIKAIYATDFKVDLKGPNDPVTAADREANEIICSALEEAFPGDAIVAEESAPKDREELGRLVSNERVWYVDPLDGTREFADRNGEFAVMVGLARRGKADLGVLVLPTSGIALAGRVGAGCFVEELDGGRLPLAVSLVGESEEARLLVSRSHRSKALEPLIDVLGVKRIIPCGSVGVKVSRIAMEGADLYIHAGGGAKRWDTCAPEAVLVSAGGRFTDLVGASIDYASVDLEQRTGIVATNALLHERVIAVTSQLGRLVTPRS